MKNLLGFHDLIHDKGTTLLLEEDAGNKDGAMIASLILVYLKLFSPRNTKSLILIFDNCSYDFLLKR